MIVHSDLQMLWRNVKERWFKFKSRYKRILIPQWKSEYVIRKTTNIVIIHSTAWFFSILLLANSLPPTEVLEAALNNYIKACLTKDTNWNSAQVVSGYYDLGICHPTIYCLCNRAMVTSLPSKVEVVWVHIQALGHFTSYWIPVVWSYSDRWCQHSRQR